MPRNFGGVLTVSDDRVHPMCGVGVAHKKRPAAGREGVSNIPRVHGVDVRSAASPIITNLRHLPVCVGIHRYGVSIASVLVCGLL